MPGSSSLLLPVLLKGQMQLCCPSSVCLVLGLLESWEDVMGHPARPKGTRLSLGMHRAQGPFYN